MQRPGSRTVEVELVEDDAPDAGGPAHGTPPLRTLVRRLPRGARLGLLGALVLAGVAAGVADVVADRAREARLARTAGLTGSLAAPLQEVWSTTGSGFVMAIADDVVVHGDHLGDGAVGTDLRDGATRYTAGGSCRLEPLAGEERSFRGPLASWQVLPGDVLLCVERSADGLGDPFSVVDTTVTVLDPVTGETRRRFVVVAGDAWDVVDGDLVAIGLDADRRVQAGRWSLVSGEPRWEYRGTEPAPQVADGPGFSLGERTIGLELGPWSVELDVGTGAPVEPGPRDDGGDPFVRRVDLPGGGAIEYRPDRSGNGILSTVHPADGSEPAVVRGFVLAPAVDDGSVPGTAMVIGFDGPGGSQAVSLVDLDTGRPRWTTDVPGQVALLSELVVVVGDTRTAALDARTGETRWESTSVPASYSGWGLVTDGHRVLLLEGPSSERRLVARDVVSGEEVWSADPLVADGSLIPLSDGGVLTVGSSELALLRAGGATVDR